MICNNLREPLLFGMSTTESPCRPRPPIVISRKYNFKPKPTFNRRKLKRHVISASAFKVGQPRAAAGLSPDRLDSVLLIPKLEQLVTNKKKQAKSIQSSRPIALQVKIKMSCMAGDQRISKQPAFFKMLHIGVSKSV